MKKILNSRVIKTIQGYLAAMDWSQKEYKGELLCAYLKGVKEANYELGIYFKLTTEKISGSYEIKYVVNVYKYNDYADCWSGNEFVAKIYSNLYKEVKEDED